MSAMNFAWRLPLMKPKIFQVSNDLPMCHTWQIHKDFMEKYSRTVTASKSALRHNYQDLMGDYFPAASKAQAEKQRQIAIFVSEQDKAEIFLTYLL